jgi:hypothetical protein
MTPSGASTLAQASIAVLGQHADVRMTWSGCVTVALCLVLSVASSGASRTSVHFYSAFKNGKLRTSSVVTERVRGRCYAGSEVEGRPYVWICVWGNVLADPCFSATATSNNAFCPLAPWSNRGALVTARLRDWKPTRPQIIKTWPWGIQTTTGLRCRAIRTGTSFIRGLRVNHGCDKGGFLVGPVDRRSPTWTILYGKRFDGEQTKLTRIPIRSAWW